MDFSGINPVKDWERGEPGPGGGVLLWDDGVHEKLESKQLYFWRLSFSPRYPRKRVFENLARFYKDASITSYVVYETLGEFDLLLRVWAPRASNAQELEHLLRQNLKGCYLWNLNYIECRTEFHFTENGLASDRPSKGTLDTVNAREIELVNTYNEEQWRRHLNREATADVSAARPPEIETLLNDRVLRHVALDTRGIRVFMTFDHPKPLMSPDGRDWMVEKIRTKCAEIRGSWLDRTETLPSGKEVPIEPPNLSIYAGTGSMTDFLIMARAPHRHFHHFVRELIFGIREIGLDETYAMRPYTHVMADRMFSDFKEHWELESEESEVADLIQAEEDQTLELKATLSTNFRSLVAANRHEPDPAMLDEVVRGVCGFLNSDGGTLVIGVLEVKRELEKVKEKERYLRFLREKFGYSGAADESFPNAVVGIEVDLAPDGPLGDSDAYLLHLRDALKSRIAPNPWIWLEAELERVGEKRICIIRVRPGEVWFYARVGDSSREEFFVREGASTPMLSGPSADLFKQVHPRGLRFPLDQAEQDG